MRNSLLKLLTVQTLSSLILMAASPIVFSETEANWSSVPDLPTELVRSTGVYFPPNGCFYAMGGRMSDTLGADMTTPYEYNPKTNRWSFKTAPFPDNEVNNMACGVLTTDGTPYIYCVGGMASRSATATKRVFRYNPVTDKIQSAGIDRWNEEMANSLPGGSAVVGNKLYLIGGFALGAGPTNRIFEFAPANSLGSQWEQKAATLPEPLSFLPTAAVGNLIFTAGGASLNACDLHETNQCYVYDPAKDSLSQIAKIPRPTAEAQAFVVGKEMWVLGGGRAAPNPSAEVNIYNPLTGQWRVGPPMSIGLRNFAAASDGVSVVVAGGYKSESIASKSAQIYRVNPAITQ